MITAMLLDDEEDSLHSLEILIKEYCPKIEILGKYQNSKLAVIEIIKLKPEILFLDIEMPLLNGFEVLEEIKNVSTSVIFTTAFDHYAVRAIKYSALDYLLKPVEPKELMQAFERYVTNKSKININQVEHLLDIIKARDKVIKKIAVPQTEGFKFISINDIISCEAEGNYTQFNLRNKERMIACRSLKEVHTILEDNSNFVRIHHSAFVNLNEVSRYIRGDGGYLIMSDGSKINVSRNKKEALLKYLAENNISF